VKSILLTLILFCVAAQDEHDPNAPCLKWCAPGGHEDEAKPPEGVAVVTCAGTQDGGCAVGGAWCGQKDRQGCSVWCKSQCCSCCGI
jgi:hypothetical protein